MLSTEFKKRFPELTILDIRTPYEIEAFDMGGIQIPLDELLLDINKIEHLKNEELVISILCWPAFQISQRLKNIRQS